MRILRPNSCARAIAVAAVLMAYCMASLGLAPSPSSVISWLGVAISTDRYPCEGCACGCASARECWTRCCCHSEHERLVWAILAGVMPPDDVVFSDEQWIAAINDITPGRAHCALCVTQVKDELRHGIAAPEPRQVAATCDRGCSKAQASTPAAPAARTVSPGRGSMSALSCKSISSLLPLLTPLASTSGLDSFLLPAPPRAAGPAIPSREIWTSRSLEVPAPPPRNG